MPEPIQSTSNLTPEWQKTYQIFGEIVNQFSSRVPYYAGGWRLNYRPEDVRPREYSDQLFLAGLGFDLYLFGPRTLRLSLTEFKNYNPCCVIHESLKQPPTQLDRYFFYSHSRPIISRLTTGLDLEVDYAPLRLIFH